MGDESGDNVINLPEMVIEGNPNEAWDADGVPKLGPLDPSAPMAPQVTDGARAYADGEEAYSAGQGYRPNEVDRENLGAFEAGYVHEQTAHRDLPGIGGPNPNAVPVGSEGSEHGETPHDKFLEELSHEPLPEWIVGE